MFDYCEICKDKTSTCEYEPTALLIALQSALDDFECNNLCCPADFLVFSDVHEEFLKLRHSINNALSMYSEKK